MPRRTSLPVLRELSPAIVGVGVAVTIGLRLLHGPLFR